MKRYLLFFGPSFYPVGGWHDFQKDFDSLEDAAAFAGTEMEKEDNYGMWYHIVDITTGKIVDNI